METVSDEDLHAGFLEGLGGVVRAIRPVEEWTDDLEARFVGGRLLFPQGNWAVSSLSPQLEREREAVRDWTRRILEENPGARGRELRPVPGETEVVPAKIWEARLAEKESELCLWRDWVGKVRLGTTVWVYSPEEFARRDVDKPFRPQRRGMMPPKLARQMVNLARTADTKKMLDPFCGSGVTLIEGLALGLEVAGSDNREEAVLQSRKNVDWFLKASAGIPPERALFIDCLDARQLSSKLEPLSFDAVIAEGDLGPAIRGRLSRKAAVGFLPRLEALYTAAFAEIRIVLKPGGRVCLAVPFWQPSEGDPIFLNLERRLRLIGYQPVLDEKGFDPILYRRKDQRVGRAIYLLESPV